MGDNEDEEDLEQSDEPFQAPLTDELDLHGFQPGDVADVVAEYCRAAAEAGFAEVRLIHGKGRGVQRRIVQSVLARHPNVIRYWDAPAHLGHFGATVAALRSP